MPAQYDIPSTLNFLTSGSISSQGSGSLAPQDIINTMLMGQAANSGIHPHTQWPCSIPSWTVDDCLALLHQQRPQAAPPASSAVPPSSLPSLLVALGMPSSAAAAAADDMYGPVHPTPRFGSRLACEPFVAATSQDRMLSLATLNAMRMLQVKEI